MDDKTLAELMGKYLDEQDWNIFEVEHRCPSCSYRSFARDDLFCPKCGEKYVTTVDSRSGVSTILDAIKYARGKK